MFCFVLYCIDFILLCCIHLYINYCKLSSVKLLSMLLMNIVFPSLIQSYHSQVIGDHKFHTECFSCNHCKCYLADEDDYIMVERHRLLWYVPVLLYFSVLLCDTTVYHKGGMLFLFLYAIIYQSDKCFFSPDKC